MAGKSPLTKRQVSHIRRLTVQGWSQRDIAERVGVTQTCVMRWQCRLGLKANGYATERARDKRRQACMGVCKANGVACLNEFQRINRAIQQMSVDKRKWDEENRC